MEKIILADSYICCHSKQKRRNNKRAGIQKDLSMEVIVPENY